MIISLHPRAREQNKKNKMLSPRTLVALCAVLLSCACSVSAQACGVMGTTYVWTDTATGALRYTWTNVCYGGSCFNTYGYPPRVRTSAAATPSIRAYCCYAIGTVMMTLPTYADMARTIPAGSISLLIASQCACSAPEVPGTGVSLVGASIRPCWQYP